MEIGPELLGGHVFALMSHGPHLFIREQWEMSGRACTYKKLKTNQNNYTNVLANK
jgi:hypothetical protein